MSKFLKIGGHQVQVIIKDIDGDDVTGITDWNVPSITINSKTSQCFKESTLIHEALHCMNTTIDEEPLGHVFLDSFSEQMYQFLSDNGLLNKEAFLALFSEDKP